LFGTVGSLLFVVSIKNTADPRLFAERESAVPLQLVLRRGYQGVPAADRKPGLFCFTDHESGDCKREHAVEDMQADLLIAPMEHRGKRDN